MTTSNQCEWGAYIFAILQKEACIIRSDDRGETWVKVQSPDMKVHTPRSIDLIDLSFIVVGGDDGYIFASYDCARTFETLEPGNATVGSITEIRIDRNNPLIIRGTFDDFPRMMTVSSDSGRTWRQKTRELEMNHPKFITCEDSINAHQVFAIPKMEGQQKIYIGAFRKKHQADWAVNMLNELWNERPVDSWVSVEDELPETDEGVYIRAKNLPSGGIGRYCKKGDAYWWLVKDEDDRWYPSGWVTHWWKEAPEEDTFVTCETSTGAFKALAQDVTDMLNELWDECPVDGWISVEDKLPEIGEEVRVRENNSSIFLGYYGGTCNWATMTPDGWWHFTGRITHWRKEAPGGDTEPGPPEPSVLNDFEIEQRCFDDYAQRVADAARKRFEQQFISPFVNDAEKEPLTKQAYHTLYQFSPRDDITVLELTRLLKASIYLDDGIPVYAGKIPPGTERHFERYKKEQ